MRRADKAITDLTEIEAIIRRAQVCRLGMCDGSRPYIVPMCFGLTENRLYLHSAGEGHKIDVLRVNPNVCVEFDIDQEVVPAPAACRIGMKYRSVIGYGTATIVEDPEEKRRGLEAIVLQYADRCEGMTEQAVAHTTIIRVDVQEFTGKQSGY
ncbi:MAG: pyridoxamine 5'-phosphate oxidase family protein [Armatimonadota bacterium]